MSLASNDQEKGILVAVRMRPLNASEASNGSRVWRVLSKYNSVAQCTPTGRPVAERALGRNFFAYDKTFGEISTTRDVYDGTARDIVDGVIRGINGTLIAYGKKGTGKTMTMCGSLSMGKEGIVQMAVGDIYNSILRERKREFVVRTSCFEICDEEVRDVDVLPMADDPSSGSHVAIKIIVKSYPKGSETKGGGLKASLTLVDLAGGSDDQSLHALERVFWSLKGGLTPDFSASRLTRILQPSLSGNSNVALICCATPSELYVEGTRLTLQLASVAKLVKTRAQVNDLAGPWPANGSLTEVKSEYSVALSTLFGLGVEMETWGRLMIMWSHFRGDLNVGESTIAPGALPRILAWVAGGPDEAHERTVRLDALYRIVRIRPELCVSSTEPIAHRTRSRFEEA